MEEHIYIVRIHQDLDGVTMADTAGYAARPVTPGKRVTMATTSPTGRSVNGRPSSQELRRPSSRGSLTTPPAGRLSPMPDYMRPIMRSAVHKWKKLHEEHMMQQLVQKRLEKKAQNQATRDNAKHMARKIPMELLASDWLKQHAPTAETRAYVVDKILPTLIIGVEKLLLEVEKKGLAEKDQIEANFNPVNFLAQYLMRNNPRYSNFSEASPYIRNLRAVSEELKQELFDIDENRLARIKAEAKKKREDREEAERLVELEKKRRSEAMKQQFELWNINIDGKVELALIQNALRSFAEFVECYPDDLRQAAKFSVELEPTDNTGRTISNKEFMEYLNRYVDDLPSDVFDAFMEHMTHCAKSYRFGHEQEQRRVQLTQLFVSCDHGGIGLLDRHRILNLFEMFWDKARPKVKEILRNPRKWPVVEVNEMEIDFLSDEEDVVEQQDPTFIDNNVDVTEQTKAGEAGSSDQPGGDTESEVKPDSSPGGTTGGTQTEADDQTNDKAAGTEEANQDAAAAKKGRASEETRSNASEVKSSDAGTPKVAVTKPAESESRGGTTDDDDKDPELANLGGAVSTSPEKPPLTQQSKVSFAEGTTFQKERSLLMSQASRSQSQASVFDENALNVSQFVHVTETFLGEGPPMDIFTRLTRFLKEGYLETEDEKMERLLRAKKEALVMKRRNLLSGLFEMWDNDGSGFLELDDIEVVMKKYKDGMEDEAIEQAKEDFKKKSKFQDNRLSKREFREFIFKAVSQMAGGDEAFDYFTDYLTNSVERTYQERVRGEARKKWLQQIITAAETSGARMEPVYRTVFQSLYKDAETHGNGKRVSAYIAMSEMDEDDRGRSQVVLRYTAATTEDAYFLVGNKLNRNMKGISFAALDTGKPIHVPRVNTHGNIHFWNPDHKPEDRDGSFIVVPLKDRKKRVFGLLGIDTLNDPHSRAIFITHEIQFFQGVAKAFSIAYHHVDIRQKTMRISESAVSWIHRRSPHVHEIVVYMTEPDGKGEDFVLRKMMITDHKGMAKVLKNPPALERKDNLFRDYLFKCVDNSESVSADAYGQRHLAIPLRDFEGRAIVVVDISIGEMKKLPKTESREMMRMVKLLQMAYDEISKESREGERNLLLEGEQDADTRVEILFDRLMLMELRENVSKLDARAYAELKSYKEPPRVVHQILMAVLSVFYPDKARLGELQDWNKCKQFVNPHLNQMILSFDPTQAEDDIPVELINGYLADVPHGMVSKHGSIPAQYLYNWVFVCVSLIEHTRKMDAARSTKMPDESDAGELTQSTAEPSTFGAESEKPKTEATSMTEDSVI